MYINKGQVQLELTKMEESVELLHGLIYDGCIDKGFATLPKTEQVAIIGLFNDAINYRNALAKYLGWFEDSGKAAK